MTEEETHAKTQTNVQNVAYELKNVSPEIRVLLDMFEKQNKQDNKDVDNSDYGKVVKKKEVLVYDKPLYATNNEASAESQVIQFNPSDISANSPIESFDNTPVDLDNSHRESEIQNYSATLSPDQDPLSVPSPDPNESVNYDSSNPYKIPGWVRQSYPELYQVWESVSASEFYQGGLELLCSICKKNPYLGFHENLPVCEADRVGRACTVCRLRPASGFSHGLALCEADRLFLYRTFSQQTKLERCLSLCPVTVQKWCGYCRLRTCLSTKGFRFFTEASNKALIDQKPTGDSRKRKYSGKVIIQEQNFIPDSVAQDSNSIPNAFPPEPGFGVPASVQAQQTTSGISTQSIPTTTKPNLGQSLAEANPLLVQLLSQPISSFNLRPGMSKAEIASSAPARAFTPHPIAGVQIQSTAYNQQHPSRAFTPITPTNSHPRATTSTPIPPSFTQSLAFIPPSSAQMGRYSQFSQSVPSFSQSRLYYSHPHPQRAGHPMQSPFFNGAVLGLRNEGTRAPGVLTDPTKQEWVRAQQEKYLKFHLGMFRAKQAKGM